MYTRLCGIKKICKNSGSCASDDEYVNSLNSAKLASFNIPSNSLFSSYHSTPYIPVYLRCHYVKHTCLYILICQLVNKFV